jgi:hypothetical protein
MRVDQVFVIAIPVLTSAAGDAVIRYPVERASSISVSVEKEGFATGRASTRLESSPTNSLEVELAPPLRLTGVARDSTGAPLPGVTLALWPQWRASA